MIVPFFPPMGGGGVHRPLSFVRHLAAHGWGVTVVAPRGDAFWIRDESLLARVPPGVRVVRTRTMSGQALLRRGTRSARGAPRRSSRGFGLLRRAASAVMIPDTYIGWYPFAVPAALRAAHEETHHAIYSTSPPESAHLVAAAVYRRTGLPWVADFRDPWMNLHLLDLPSALHGALHRRLERSVCRRAELVTTTAWSEELLRRAWPSARVTRIANGYDADAIAALHAAPPEPGGPLRIVHAGMLTQRRSAVPFLEALRSLLDRRPDARGGIEATFAGAREDRNDRAVERLGLAACVRFVEVLPHGEALRLQGSAHVLLLIKHADPRYNGLVPGKLYEYIGLCRPVLALAPEGEARTLVETSRRGEAADPSDVPAIARALERLYDRHRMGTLEAGYDLSARPEFDRAREAESFAELLRRVTEEAR